MKKILFAAIFSSLIFSCNKSDSTSDIPEGQGQLSLALVADESVEEVTKSDSDVDLSTFKIDIYKDAGDGEYGDLVVSYDEYASMPDYITLDVGDYVVDARSMDQVAAGFDTPYYHGKQRVSIEALTVGSAEITCALENVKITVGYSDAFINQFESFKIIVEVKDPNEVPDGEEYSLEFDQYEEREAYFMVTDLRLIVDAVQKSGESYSDVRYIEDPQAKDYYKITYDITAIGESTFTLVVDKTTNDIEHDILVPSDEEDLGDGANPDDPDYSFAPTISMSGYDIDEVIVISTSENIEGASWGGACNIPLVLNVSATGLIASLKVTIDAPEINSLAEQMFGSLTFDLANVEAGSDLETNLTNLGLYDASDPINGKSSHSFEITAFMGMLGFTEGYETSTSYFTIDVTDYNDKETSEVVTIKRVP